MAMHNPKGRANYEPNSWGEAGGPRETPSQGFRSFAESSDGTKTRLRPESFADHYSQARMFYRSQLAPEQKHIANALVFELSKVERPDIRERVVSHLLVIEQSLGAKVADGLGLQLPKPARPARKPIDVKTSEALSIVAQAKGSFEGRKLGILATEGVDAKTFNALVSAAGKAGGICEIVAAKIAGVTLSDGTAVPAKQKIDGGPSVLFDAIAILASEDGLAPFLKDAASQDFVRDAYAHCKFLAYSREAKPLLDQCGLSAEKLDGGCFELGSSNAIAAFTKACGRLRFWDREAEVDLDD